MVCYNFLVKFKQSLNSVCSFKCWPFFYFVVGLPFNWNRTIIYINTYKYIHLKHYLTKILSINKKSKINSRFFPILTISIDRFQCQVQFFLLCQFKISQYRVSTQSKFYLYTKISIRTNEIILDLKYGITW